MSNQDRYEQWKASRKDVPAPPDFADSVMNRISGETPNAEGETTGPHESQKVSAPPQRTFAESSVSPSLTLLATCAAIVVFAARVAHMLSFLWPVG